MPRAGLSGAGEAAGGHERWCLGERGRREGSLDRVVCPGEPGGDHVVCSGEPGGEVLGSCCPASGASLLLLTYDAVSGVRGELEGQLGAAANPRS